MLNIENFKSALKQKYTSKEKKSMDMSKGKAMVERMKARVRAKLKKKNGGSIKEKLAAARKNNPVNSLGSGKSKVESKKAKIRAAIEKRYK